MDLTILRRIVLTVPRLLDRQVALGSLHNASEAATDSRLRIKVRSLVAAERSAARLASASTVTPTELSAKRRGA